MLEACVTRMISLDVSIRLPKIFKHGLPTSACLIERVTDRLINFQASFQRKGLISSSYSSAAEFTTAITDRRREQQGAQVLRRFSDRTNCALSYSAPVARKGESNFKCLIAGKLTRIDLL